MKNFNNKTLNRAEEDDNSKRIIQYLPDALIAFDLNGIITFINSSAEKLTGWMIDDAIGKQISAVIKLKNIETGVLIKFNPGDINDTIKSPGFYNNKNLVTKDFHDFKVSINASELFDERGDVSGSVLVIRDMTEYLKVEERIRQSEKIDSISNITGKIAHEFNNMLGAIMGSVELLLIHLKNDDLLRGYGETILNASEKAAELTHKLLVYSRKGKMKNEDINIHKSIENVLSVFERTIDNKIDVNFNSEAENIYINGDSRLIENALLNIFKNSKTAMSDGGVLDITTENVNLDSNFCDVPLFNAEPGNYIKITVSDTGVGIPEMFREKIFEPFFSINESGRGTGIGLSIVYVTIKEHKGMIKLESEIGKGTSMSIYLPLPDAAGGSEPDRKNYTYKGEGSVLVIDDEALIRESASNLLRNMSYEVMTAVNGKEGVEVYRMNKDKISLVILDMLMPGLSGKETFARLREENPSLTVILSSGFSCDLDAQELLDSGAAGFIQKPYKSSDLAYVLMLIDKQNRRAKGI